MIDKRLWMAIPLAGVLALGGCSTTTPQAGDAQRNNTVTGAGIGAAVGAVAGLLTGDSAASRRDHAAIGAALGAAAGGGIGYYMDQQEQQLRERLQGTGIGVKRQGNDIVLNMPNQVTFGLDSSELSGQARQALNEVTAVLREYPETRITVAGYTDSTGTEQYNQRLSERRAAAVASYLIQGGVASQRINRLGYGESRPVASNETEQGRAQNRRVEITVTPIQQQ